MGDITQFQQAGMPVDVDRMKQGLQRARQQAPSLSGGIRFLKMNQVGMANAGMLTYGAEGTEVEEGSEWVCNTRTMQHGFILRDGGSVNAEIFVSVFDPLPNQAELRPTRGNEQWRQAYKGHFMCVSGEDEGVIVEYSGDAGGVVKLFAQTIMPALDRQIDEHPDTLYPVLTWEIDSYYSNKQKKEIFEAKGTIERWMTEDEVNDLKVADTPADAKADDDDDGDGEAPEEPVAKRGRGRPKKEDAAPQRRRRRA